MIVCQSAPPASAPDPRLTARSMLSIGTEFLRAFWIASNRVGLPSGSPPPVRDATSMFLISFANSLPRLASTTAFLCLVVAHFEWPLIDCPSPSRRRAREYVRHPSAPGGTTWPAVVPGEPRQSYRRPVRPLPPRAASPPG